MYRRFAVFVCILAFAFAPGGCRSRSSKAKPQTQPSVEATPTPQPTPVASDDRGFQTDQPAVERLPDELGALNEMARQKGWIEDAFFRFDDGTLTGAAQAALTKSAKWLRDHPGYRLVIEGHCDERGTASYNLSLGERRASAAREYLASLGIADERMSTVSFGEERPFASGSNEAAWAENRRAHLVLTR